MKLIVKTLKGKQFEIEVELSDTVKQVKDKIDEEHKIAADTQKLVAIGKVMDDAKTVEDYKLKEGDFIVVMVAKPKKPKTTAPAPAPAAEPAPTSEPVSSMAPPASTQPAPSNPAPTGQAPAPVPQPSSEPAASTGEGGGILRGEALETTLTELQNMGFPRDECMRALRAAFYNPDRAVDYLLNGIPEGAGEQPQPAANPAAGVSPGAGAGADLGAAAAEGLGGAEGGANPLSFLQNNPMFDQLRQRLVTEPQFFQTFMNQLAQTQPQLHQAISANPQAFLQLLLGSGAGGAGGDMGPENDPPGTIRVTPEEKDAIERLSGLGFPKHRAIEAFFACDKNEEWAANYLFENNMADDNYEDQMAQEESAADAGVQLPGGDAQPAPANPVAPAQESQAPADTPAAAQSDDMQVDQPAAAESTDPPANSDNNNEDKKDDDEGEGSSL